MPTKISSQGECIFCQKTFSKASLTRHLHTHLAEKVMSNKPGKSFHVKIENDPRWGSSPYFLHLWVDGNATLQKIDTLLRQIWLECCGHMSAFNYPQQKQISPMNFMQAIAKGKMQLGEYGEIAMNKKASHIFREDLKLKYEYDFGSTTQLQLAVVKEFNITADQPIVLLSRNEPLGLLCEICGEKPATKLCSVCEDESMFCADCAKQHAKKCADYADYAAMPVVNSPRMGVCAYEGGSIDIERD